MSLTKDGFAPDLQRRAVVLALAASALATTLPRPALAQSAEPAFLQLSTLLTGRSSLDTDQAARLHEALVADDPQFDDAVAAVLALIAEQKLDAGGLQQALDQQSSDLAPLPRRIMTAWYTGVVGEGAEARCLSFETALMHQAVADKLNPPSYCYGPYASWTEAPA